MGLTHYLNQNGLKNERRKLEEAIFSSQTQKWPWPLRNKNVIISSSNPSNCVTFEENCLCVQSECPVGTDGHVDNLRTNFLQLRRNEAKTSWWRVALTWCLSLYLNLTILKWAESSWFTAEIDDWVQWAGSQYCHGLSKWQCWYLGLFVQWEKLEMSRQYRFTIMCQQELTGTSGHQWENCWFIITDSEDKLSLTAASLLS